MGSQGGAYRRCVRAFARPPALALTAASWSVGLAVTALIVGTPYLVFGYRSPSVHLVLDSVDSCVALLVAYLVYGRFLRGRRLQDLLLAEGVFLLAIAGLGLTSFLGLFHDFRPETLDVWLPLVVRVVGALLVMIAALVGERDVHRGRYSWARVAPWAVVAVVVVALWLERDRLPPALGSSPPASAQHPVISGHPLLLAAHAVMALSFVVASVMFTARAGRRDDELLRWLGPAWGLAAFARLNYVLYPSLYSDWIYTGDLLRTGCYLLLVVGAAREIRRYWTAQARAAVLEDRRRLARELHDGVVQELGYIRAVTGAMAPAVPVVPDIIASCDRALDEARAAVDALGRSPDEPLGFVIHRAAQQVVERYDGQLEVDLDDSVTADVDQQHALVRITREAVSNALRHGDARRVCIRLTHDHVGHQLVVQDDGHGFDVGSVPPLSTGYGLTSMRDRAQGLPGSLTIESAPGRGTKVGVVW
jgi:signal transduction histidine kinase